MADKRRGSREESVFDLELSIFEDLALIYLEFSMGDLLVVIIFEAETSLSEVVQDIVFW